MSARSVFFCCMWILMLSACDTFHPKATVPAYLHIDSILLSITDPALQGSASSLITDAWVYVDDEAAGAYELPATFPVLADGTHEVRIRGGIKDNGIAATRAYYPMFADYKANINLIPDSTVTLGTPIVSYKSAANFAWMEDFENGASLDSVYGSSLPISVTADTSLVMEGSKSGYVLLTDGMPDLELWSSDYLVLPKATTPVYLELNFNTTLDIAVTLWVDDPVTPSIMSSADWHYLRSTNGIWKKIYINLTDDVSNAINAAGYKIAFIAGHQSGDPDDVVMLDNIKLIHL